MSVSKLFHYRFVGLSLTLIPLLSTAAGFTFRPFNQHEYMPPPVNPMRYPRLPQTPNPSLDNNPVAGAISPVEPAPFYSGHSGGVELNTPYPATPSQANPPTSSNFTNTPRRTTRNREIEFQGYRFRADEHSQYDTPLPLPMNQSLPVHTGMGTVAPGPEGYNPYGYGYPNSDFRPMESKSTRSTRQPYGPIEELPVQSWQNRSYQSNPMNSSGYNNSTGYGGSASENYNYVPNNAGQDQSWTGYPKTGTEEIKPGW